jgi:2-deoxy-D-gluconate 3-dehydrogenase
MSTRHPRHRGGYTVSAAPLTDTHVLVTGAGRGIGRALAIACGHDGAVVSLIARTAEQIDSVAQEIRDFGGTAYPYPFDVADTDGIRDLIATVDVRHPITGVVHAAGIQIRQDAVTFDVDDWRHVQQVNVEAPFLLSQALAQLQISDQRQRCSHVFIGSLGSSIAIPRGVAYAASKSALLGIVRTLATEWATHRIRVNAVAPGYFHTELTRDLLSDPAQHARVLSRIPMGRLGQPEELGGAVTFLLSEAASYITGQVINVDGGWLAS